MHMQMWILLLFTQHRQHKLWGSESAMLLEEIKGLPKNVGPTGILSDNHAYIFNTLALIYTLISYATRIDQKY